MDILDILKSRYSVRDYSDRQIPSDILEKILEAGRVAPTAKNQQPQRVFVLQSKEAVEKIRGITPSAYNAPTVLLICADMNVAWHRTRDSWCAAPIDTSIVTCHMMLEAEALGVGSCWVCAFDAQKVIDAFDLPENYYPYSLLDLGYASDTCEPNPRHFERAPIEDTVKYI